MKAKIKYLEPHPRSGVLRFRRRFPPHLQPYIPGSTQLMRSIGARKITEPGALDQYHAALADYERIVSAARKQAAGAFDTLPDPEITYLAAVFARDQAEWIEKGRLRPDAEEFAEKALEGVWWMEDEYLRWRVGNDVDEMIAHWARQARGLLDERGIILDPKDMESLGRLCRALNDTAIEIRDSQRARLSGKVLPVPVEPETPAVESKPGSLASDGRSFEDIAESLLENPRLAVGASTKQASRTALRSFREAHGRLLPSKITKALVSEWLDLLARRPAKLALVDRKLLLRDLVARYDGKDVDRLTNKTMGQHLASLGALWNKAQKAEGHIPDGLANPFVGRQSLASTSLPKRQELSRQELQAIFALPVFTLGERPRRGKGEASYWLPLLLLWTGARPEELAQLIVNDVSQDPDDPKGRWVLRITDEGIHPHKGKRALKTSKKDSEVGGLPAKPLAAQVVNRSLLARPAPAPIQQFADGAVVARWSLDCTHDRCRVSHADVSARIVVGRAFRRLDIDLEVDEILHYRGDRHLKPIIVAHPRGLDPEPCDPMMFQLCSQQ